MSNITVNIKRLDPTVELPKYAHPTDAGLDLRSNEDCILKPFERRLVSTGLAIALPDGYAGFVQPRSGLAIKQGLSIVNTPGLIDAHYRGELKVILINLDPTNNIQINKGDRIAQLVIQEVPTVNLVEVCLLYTSGAVGSSDLEIETEDPSSSKSSRARGLVASRLSRPRASRAER